MKLAYVPRRFSMASSRLITQANDIIEEYQGQGFSLTLRQLYYQFVARGLLPNRQSEYKRLGSIINDARLAGLIDWLAIEDRTRNLEALANWSGPGAIIDQAAAEYRRDRWADQPEYVEVWIEKDALTGVIEGICDELDVAYLSCRGYTSQSEMWAGGQRLKAKAYGGRRVTVLHLGDHDPSGLDMTRDIDDRLELFTSGMVRVDRIALTMEQVRQYDPPPNPAKLTDSRAEAYIAAYGGNSWELDALEPAVMTDLIREAVLALRDEDIFDETVDQEAHERGLLQKAARDIRKKLDK